jgi:hypothetical protein
MTLTAARALETILALRVFAAPRRPRTEKWILETLNPEDRTEVTKALSKDKTLSKEKKRGRNDS